MVNSPLHSIGRSSGLIFWAVKIKPELATPEVFKMLVDTLKTRRAHQVLNATLFHQKKSFKRLLDVILKKNIHYLVSQLKLNKMRGIKKKKRGA